MSVSGPGDPPDKFVRFGRKICYLGNAIISAIAAA